MKARKKKDTMTSTEAKNNFGELLDFARSRPMKIEKNGRPVAVVLSAEEFERLEAIEDAWWANEAQKAIAEGSLGTKASEQLLTDLLNAKN